MENLGNISWPKTDGDELAGLDPDPLRRDLGTTRLRKLTLPAPDLPPVTMRRSSSSSWSYKY
jgi:hypothetical protein